MYDRQILAKQNTQKNHLGDSRILCPSVFPILPFIIHVILGKLFHFSLFSKHRQQQLFHQIILKYKCKWFIPILL